MFGGILRGAAAGAAGTTALNAATYLDMALRARPASSLPQQAVDRLADETGHPVPGEGEQHENRLQGLGPLAGVATGVGAGALAGLLRPVTLRLPPILGALLLGGVAMAGSDLPAAKLKVTDPASWSAAEWLSDAVPHLAYGIVTYATLAATGGRRRRSDRGH